MKKHREPRPMTGLLALLSPEQRAAILAYKGPENHMPARYATTFSGPVPLFKFPPKKKPRQRPHVGTPTR